MFHRLTVPSYIGGLPGGYDYLNNQLFGTPAPIDPVKASGVNVGTYFVAFGEDGRAAAANRAVASVAANTDAIDDFLHANTAVTASVDINPVAAAVIVGTATNPVFCGPPGTPNTVAGLEPYFHITDFYTNDDLVDPSTNVQVKVTAVSAGIGTFFAGSVTLTLSPAPTVPYRIWYGTRSSLAEMTKGEFVRPAIWSVQKRQAGFIQFTNNLINPAADNSKGGSLVGIYDTTFNPATVPGGGLGGLGIVNVQQAIQKINDRFFGGAGKVDIDTDGFLDPQAVNQIRGGGLGAPGFSPVNVQRAIETVEKQLVRRRAFTAVVTDGTNTVGGDYNGTNLDAPLTDFSNGESLFLRNGIYYINDATGLTLADGLRIAVEAPGAAMLLAAGRTFDLGLESSMTFDGPMGLVSLSTNGARYRVTPLTDSHGFTGRELGIMSGALFSQGATSGGRFVLEDAYVVGTGVGAGTTNAALDLTGEHRTSIRRSQVAGVNGTTPRAFYVHDIGNDQYSSVTVEDSKFRISDVNVNALELKNVSVPTIYRNCLIELTATSGTGYAALIDSCTFIEFDNCIFRSANGQVIRSLGSTVHLRNCFWVSTDAAPGAATKQMIVIQPSGNGPSSISNCHCIIGASSVRGSSGTKAVIELGGLDGTAAGFSGMQINRLSIVHSAGISLMHDYTTVLLHGNASSRYLNSYNDVTFDTNSVNSDGSGTLAGNYTVPGFPSYVEVGGGSRATCTVNRLALTNVKSPGSTHNRYLIYAVDSTLNDIIVEGSGSAGAGSYSEQLYVFDSCELTNLRVTRSHPIKCTGSSHVALKGSTKWRGGVVYFNTSTWPAAAWVQYVSAHCDIREVTMFWGSSVGASTVPGVKSFLDNDGLFDCTLWVDGVWTAAKLVSFTSGDVNRIQRNRLFWRNTTINQMLESTGSFSIVTENQMYDGGTNIPTYSVTGTAAVDDNNVTFAITGPAAINPVL